MMLGQMISQNIMIRQEKGSRHIRRENNFMAMIVCPHCGEQVSEKAKKCVHCGAILIPEEKKHCMECGAELEEGMTECPNCGCPVDDTIGQETDGKPQKVEVTGVKVTKKIKIIIGIVVALLVVGLSLIHI